MHHQIVRSRTTLKFLVFPWLKGNKVPFPFLSFPLGTLLALWAIFHSLLSTGGVIFLVVINRIHKTILPLSFLLLSVCVCVWERERERERENERETEIDYSNLLQGAVQCSLLSLKHVNIIAPGSACRGLRQMSCCSNTANIGNNLTF
jgi:hypothetical protein